MSLPDFEPMLATPWPAPFDDEDWWFEVKWDGYRTVIGNDGGRIRARSRRGLDMLDRFPELRSTPLPEGVIVDGEVVAFDDDGVPSFSLLQVGSPTNLVVFDLLYQGEDLTGRPYEDRRDALERLALPSPVLVPESTRGEGTALFEAVAEKGLEGIVGKRSGSRYLPGRRSPDWRKVAVRHRLRAVVGGYLAGDGSRATTFGSLLVGLHDDDGLRWIGAVGSGFDSRSLGAISAALRSLERSTSPFSDPVTLPGNKTWVEPSIVITVEYKEWTREGRMRAPVFKGVEVADPESVTWAEEAPA